MGLLPGTASHIQLSEHCMLACAAELADRSTGKAIEDSELV
jgi:hypothetical protein